MNSYYLTLVLKPDLEEKVRKELLDGLKKKFEKEDDNSATISLTFNVPETAEEGDYNVNAVVVFDDGDETSDTFQTLTVSGSITPEPKESIEDKEIEDEEQITEDFIKKEWTKSIKSVKSFQVTKNEVVIGKKMFTKKIQFLKKY